MPIDIRENPVLNKDTAQGKSQDNVNLLSRFLRNVPSGAAWLPDLAINSAERLGNLLAGRPNPYNVDNAPLGKDPIEHLIDKTGIRDIPAANTLGEKFAEGAGQFTGGFATGGGFKGFGQAAESLPGIIRYGLTKGAQIAAPAAVGPVMDKIDNNNPYITAPAQILASILAGKGAGMISPKAPLPEYTAAQNAYMENPDAPRTKTLIARQLDLAKKDPKSADALSEIGKNQEAKIVARMTPENPVSNQDITTKITDYVDELKNQRSTDYTKGKAKVLQNAQTVDPSPTLNMIAETRATTAIGSPLDKALQQVEQLIKDSAGDPQRVAHVKTTIHGMANYNSGLNLDSQSSGVMKQIAHQYGQDINKSIPGYADLNKNYSNQTDNLEEIINGMAGKVVAAGENAPSSIPRRIFEKVDPALSGQVRGVLPDEMYGQAADSYLGDVVQRAQSTPSKNTYNNGTQMYKMGEILEKNYPTLKETLPDAQMAKVDQTMKDIDVSMLGRPRNDYPIDARRGYAVGDEVKGKGSIKDALLNLATLPIRPMRRNEMLTGQSPTSQILGGITPPSIGVAAMNQPPLIPTIQPQVQNQPSQAPQPQQTAQSPRPYVASKSNGQSPIDQVMKQYGMSQNSNGQTPSQEQTLSPIDQVMKDYGIDDSLKKKAEKSNAPTQQKTPSPGAIGSDVLDFMMKEINKGNTDVLLNPKAAYDQAQLKPDVMDVVRNSLAKAESGGNYKAQAPNSSAAGKYQFIDGTRQMFFPDSTRQEFKNNPQMQEDAMNKLMESNKNDLRNRGVDVDNIAPEDLSGALHAAHLRGSGAGYHALMDANYIGDPDANGTTPRSYFNRGRQAYLNAVNTAQSKQNSEYDDLVSHAESLLSDQSTPTNPVMQNVNYPQQPLPNQNDIDNSQNMNW